MQGGGLEWLFPFQDGHPPIGWGPAASYLVLPVLLVVSQYVSQKIISTQQQTDPSQQQAQAILKVLPVMLGKTSGQTGQRGAGPGRAAGGGRGAEGRAQGEGAR